MSDAGDEERLSPTTKPLADPKEHPEQHAALQTGKHAQAEPEAEGEDEEGILHHEDHSDAPGADGTG